MNVLHIHTSTQSGGAASVARAIHASQRNAGIEAQYLAAWGDTDPDRGVHSFRVTRRVDRLNVAAYRAASLEGPFYWGKWRRILSSDMFASADVIHLHSAHGYYMPHWVLDRITDRPTVWTLHDYWLMTGRCASPGECTGFTQGCPSCPHHQHYPATLYDRADRGFEERRKLWAKTNILFAAPTEFTRRQFVDQGMPAERIYTVPNPVDLPVALKANSAETGKAAAKLRLGLTPEQKVVLFAARKLTDPLKGFPIAIDALGRLGRREGVCAIFLGEESAVSRAQVRALDIETHIAGLITNRDQMANYLLAADIVLAPSLSETFGLLLVEAVAAGAALVAGDIPVIHEVLAAEGETPWLRLASVQDSGAMTGHLLDLLQSGARPSPEYRRTLRGRYESEHVSRLYMDLYGQAAKQSP